MNQPTVKSWYQWLSILRSYWTRISQQYRHGRTLIIHSWAMNFNIWIKLTISIVVKILCLPDRLLRATAGKYALIRTIQTIRSQLMSLGPIGRLLSNRVSLRTPRGKIAIEIKVEITSKWEKGIPMSMLKRAADWKWWTSPLLDWLRGQRRSPWTQSMMWTQEA